MAGWVRSVGASVAPSAAISIKTSAHEFAELRKKLDKMNSYDLKEYVNGAEFFSVLVGITDFKRIIAFLENMPLSTILVNLDSKLTISRLLKMTCQRAITQSTHAIYATDLLNELADTESGQKLLKEHLYNLPAAHLKSTNLDKDGQMFKCLSDNVLSLINSRLETESYSSHDEVNFDRDDEKKA